MSDETELKLSIPELEGLRDLAFMIYQREGEGQIVTFKEAYESISEQHKNAMARIKELKAENERLVSFLSDIGNEIGYCDSDVFGFARKPGESLQSKAITIVNKIDAIKATKS